MKFKILETVVLTKDLSDEDLKIGDLGTIVELYQSGGLEVEFLCANGATKAVVTLSNKDVRRVRSTDMLAVRPLQTSSS